MRRLKYSISSILLIVAMVAIVVSTIVHRSAIEELERQRREIAQQTGYIEVKDPTQVHVRELFCPAPRTWQVQVYTPPGHQLMAGIGADLHADEDYPQRLLIETYFRRTGQTTMTISLYRDKGGRWRFTTYYPHNGTDLVLSDGDFSWVFDRVTNSGSGGEPLHGPVRTYAADTRIPLVVLRDEQHSAAGSLMVWLEPNLKQNFKSRQQNQQPTGSDQ